jgi:hypothetical protein
MAKGLKKEKNVNSLIREIASLISSTKIDLSIVKG